MSSHGSIHLVFVPLWTLMAPTYLGTKKVSYLLGTLWLHHCNVAASRHFAVFFCILLDRIVGGKILMEVKLW